MENYNHEKTPSRISPFYVAADLRIADLISAIGRHNTYQHHEKIKKWAEEIMELCNLVDYLKED